jgi:hypothetical protein
VGAWLPRSGPSTTAWSRSPRGRPSSHNVFWWQIVGLIALPVALFFGHIGPASPMGRRRPRPPPRADAAGRDPRRARRGAARPHARGRLLAARARRIRRRRRPARRATSGRSRPCGRLPRARR